MMLKGGDNLLKDLAIAQFGFFHLGIRNSGLAFIRSLKSVLILLNLIFTQCSTDLIQVPCISQHLLLISNANPSRYLQSWGSQTLDSRKQWDHQKSHQRYGSPSNRNEDQSQRGKCHPCLCLWIQEYSLCSSPQPWMIQSVTTSFIGPSSIPFSPFLPDSFGTRCGCLQ